MFVAVSEMVSQWFGGDRITQMAERVAGRSRLGVWQRVMHRLPALGPTEGRGYLRARAMAVVRSETTKLIEQEGPRLSAHRTQIEETAMQLLVNMIIAQLGQPRSQSTRRRAA
jgi:hypothetical protein